MDVEEKILVVLLTVLVLLLVSVIIMGIYQDAVVSPQCQEFGYKVASGSFTRCQVQHLFPGGVEITETVPLRVLRAGYQSRLKDIK